MNSAPKQQGGGDGSATESPSPLEQTVMGIAPPPSGAPPSHPSAAPDTASLILPSAIVAASTPPVPPPLEPAHSPTAPSGVVVAAPTIAILQVSAEPASSSGSAGENPASSPALVGATLRIEAGTPLPPPHPTAPDAGQAEHAARADRTALSADYLREARAAALDEVASRPPSTAPIGLGSVDAVLAAEPVALAASAAPGAGDTRRSIAPPLVAEAAPDRGARAGGHASTRGFEPVPVLRAPLAESLSSSLGPLAELGSTRNLLPPSSRPRPVLPRERESGASRWLLLVGVALISVAAVSVGGRLWQRYRAQGARQQVLATVEADAPSVAAPRDEKAISASHALLANRPAPDPSSGVRVLSATAAAAPTLLEPTTAASPESQLAATAGRHVLSGSYAEALPLYRQLERSWPENTAYAAMARLLEKKVGSHNDTRTITPAAPTLH